MGPIRSARFGVKCVLATALFFSSPAPAWAGDETEAAELFREGVQAFAREDYEDALEAFEESWQTFPKATTLFNIGMCHLALGEKVEAAAKLQKFLEHEGSKERPQMRQEAELELESLAARLARLRLLGVPSEATVRVDGDEKKGDLKDAIWLEPGAHAVDVVASEFAPRHFLIEAKPGDNLVIHVALDSKPKKAEEPIEQQPAGPQPQVLQTREISKPPEEASPKSVDRNNLRIPAIVGLGVGAVGIGLGTWGIIHRNDRVADANGLAALYGKTGDEDYRGRYETIRREELPRIDAGTAVAFGLGGALMSAGAVLMVLSETSREGRPQRDNTADSAKAVTVSPTPLGVQVRF